MDTPAHIIRKILLPGRSGVARFSQAFLLALCSVASISGARAQIAGAYQDTLISISPGDSVLRLSGEFVLPGSVVVSIDSVVLRPGLDYSVGARQGVVTLLPPVTVAALPRAVRIRYRYIPITVRPGYRKREAVERRDTASGAVDSVYLPARDFSPEGVFGPDLRKSGSLVRGIQVGSNRDLTLNSGFRLQMSGRLSDDLDVLAALTDENSPIQPEGNTQTLQELDRVFIELRGKNAVMTVGDLMLDFRGGQFGKLSRKLRGALGSYVVSGETDSVLIEAGGASVRGKFTTNQFTGIQGVQGPYRLRGRENEYPIIVIAGTEHVYIDGRELTRGQLNDYVIDYSLGEVTFTTRTRVTFASRIVVEFEYTDRRYARNLLGGSTRVALDTDTWTLGAMVVQENDDRESLADITLSEGDRALLAAAGDSRTLASRSGITYAGPGKGRYLMRDTLVYFPALKESRDTSILVYSPADSLNAVYSASFTYTGPGGDYEKVSSGHYRYAGPGRGNYSPLIFLPLPEKHSFADFNLGGKLTDDLSVSGEYAVSDFDGNTFSGLDDADNAGGAYDVGVKFTRRDFRFAGIGLSSLGLKARQRRIDAGFVPLERFNEVEFRRNWNIPDSAPASELLRDVAMEVGPGESVLLGGTAGWMRRGGVFSSDRYGGSLRVGGNLDYRFGYLESDDAAASRKTLRRSHEGTGRLPLGRFSPVISIRREFQTERDTAAPLARAGNYAFTEVAPGVTIDSLWGMRMSAGLGFRLDDSVRSGRLVRVSESFYQSYGWMYDGGRAFSSGLDLQLQRRRFMNDTVRDPVENTVLVRSQVKLAPFGRGLALDLFYEASPEQAAKFERIFTQVARGTGNYSYAGDLNGNGFVDEADFRRARYDGDYLLTVVPGDEFAPVINLRTSARLRVDLSRFFAPGEGGVAALLSPFSSETYIRLEEKSSDPDRSNIYFLRAGSFRNPATTLQGSYLLTQDLNLFENDPEFSLRARYQQRKSLTTLASADETAYSRERGIRLTWSLARSLSNQVEFTEKRDFLTAGEGSYRNREIRGMALALDWVYRPVAAIESGFGFTVAGSDNYDVSSASLNEQRLHIAYSLQNAGRLRVEFRREEALITGAVEDVPFELTMGRVAGKTWVWRIDFEYKLTQFLESSLRYEGRKEGRVNVIHNGSVEVRAYF